MKISSFIPSALLSLALVPTVIADIGILSFWVPELYYLLDLIETEGNPVETYTFGARKFYVTQYQGHNVIAANTGVGISNAAATTAIMLQKFPNIDRLVGSGIAGGVDAELNVGDVVIPERWALYQEQHFAKELEDGSHSIPSWMVSRLWGDDCGAALTGDASTAIPCTPGVNTWNYSYIYPQVVDGGDPTAEGDDATTEGSRSYGWFYVDPDMLAVAEQVAPSVVLTNSVGDITLDYQPRVLVGGSGVSGPTFLDNADYRQYAFDTFAASAVEMETAAAAHVATQFGKKFLFFRSLSDLAGGGDAGNELAVFFGVAAANAVATLSAFLTALPVENGSEGLPVPADFTPGEDTAGLLGVLSFYEPELEALKAIMSGGEGGIQEMVYGGRKWYRGKIAGADVVATLTGVSISNAAMTTALMAMLYPGIERIVGGGIAGGIDPSLRVGDVVIPERWSLYQMQVYGTYNGEYWVPVEFEENLAVGKECGGWDGVDSYFFGNRTCDFAAEEASNYGMMFPKTIQTPDPSADDELSQISEGETRMFWFDVDPEMYEIAKEAVAGITLKSVTSEGVELGYTPDVFFGGNGVSGPTFLDNAAYREYVFDAFEARCVDMETAAAAHIAYQNQIPVLFFRSLSDLAGAEQDENVMTVFFTLAAENAFTITSAVIEALYPVEGNETETGSPTEAPTDSPTEAGSPPTTDDGSSGPRTFGMRAAIFLSVVLVAGCM